MMMPDNQETINTLFAQLGLASDDASIDTFVANNQLPASVAISDADIWTENQRKFLKEQYIADACWVEIVDDLNTRLHKDAMDATHK